MSVKEAEIIVFLISIIVLFFIFIAVSEHFDEKKRIAAYKRQKVKKNR